MKVKWVKSQIYNSDFKQETTEYRGLKLVLSLETDFRSIKRWYGEIFSFDGSLMKTVKGYKKYALSRSVVDSRRQLLSIIDDNWNFFSGNQKAEEDEVKKRNYILQNIHWYAEIFGSNFQLDAENLHTVMKFAIDNFDEFEKLFKLRTNLADIALDYRRKYEKWLSMPSEYREREVFSHEEPIEYTRTYRDKSSYWGYDEMVTETCHSTVAKYSSNPKYVPEPRLPDQYPLLKQIQEIEISLRKAAKQG